MENNADMIMPVNMKRKHKVRDYVNVINSGREILNYIDETHLLDVEEGRSSCASITFPTSVCDDIVLFITGAIDMLMDHEVSR